MATQVTLSSNASTTVKLSLHLPGRTLHPTHVSDRDLLFAEPVQIEPTTATLYVTIDGRVHTRVIRVLAHPAGSTRVPIERVNKSASAELPA